MSGRRPNSFGNHEFDLKVNGVLPFIKAAQFPIVAANLDFSKEPLLQATNVTKSVVLEVAGRKIGVIGYLTPDTAIISSPENIIFLSEVDSIKKESERLRNEGVRIIIALGHSGILTDMQIAKEVPLVDVVIGGHTNTFLWNGEQPDLEIPYGPYPLVVEQKSGKKVYVAQAYAYTKYMGYLNLKFNSDGDVIHCEGQPILLDHNIPQDEDVLELLERYRPEVQKLSQEPIGNTKVDLDGSAESCRLKECNFGNLITDAFVAYHADTHVGSHWTDAPIALINGGSIRNTIERKNASEYITRGDLIASMPFSDSVVSISLQGEDLLKSLELAVRSNGETSYGEFLQTSGLRVVYDLSQPVGSRVVEAKARCSECRVPMYKPIDPNASYRIITTSFLQLGGDGHSVFKSGGKNVFTEDLNDLDMVVRYISKHSPIYPEEDERLLVMHRKIVVGQSGCDQKLPNSMIIILIISVGLIKFYKY